MENPRFLFVKSFIGKHFTDSPSPFAHWLNGKVVAVSENALEFSFLVRKEMTNPVGMLHGGVISGMIDDCMGVTFFTLGLEYFYPSINLHVDFFNPAKEGEIVHVKTRVMKQGKTIINIRAEVLNQRNILVATATSNLAKSTYKIHL